MIRIGVNGVKIQKRQRHPRRCEEIRRYKARYGYCMSAKKHAYELRFEGISSLDHIDEYVINLIEWTIHLYAY